MYLQRQPIAANFDKEQYNWNNFNINPLQFLSRSSFRNNIGSPEYLQACIKTVIFSFCLCSSSSIYKSDYLTYKIFAARLNKLDVFPL